MLSSWSEETDRGEGDEVRILTPVYPRQNVGRKGADIVPGQTLVRRGDVLSPARVGALAAIGVADVEVYARPSVALLSTGDEIVDPGQALAAGQIYDINRYTLETIVRAHGGLAAARPTAADTLEDLSTAVDACAGHDVFVFSGGSSVGERDLILDVLQHRGEVLFHGIAVKPGKPTVFGRIDGTPVLGMPGYPTSCLSNAYMLLVPILRRLAHLPPYRPHTVPVAAGGARRLDDRPPPVLHGPRGCRASRPGLQGLGRHHEHVAGRRLHRDPPADRHRGKR